MSVYLFILSFVLTVCVCFVGGCEDPLQGDFPEVIEEYLEYGVQKCIAFNRRGTLLAGIDFLSYQVYFVTKFLFFLNLAVIIYVTCVSSVGD